VSPPQPTGIWLPTRSDANWDLPRELLLRHSAAGPPDDDNDNDHLTISSEASEDDRGLDF